MSETLTCYIDVKSPYAYLAIEPTRRLARQTGVTLDWLPFTLDIPSYLGSAEIDDDGNLISDNRTPHQWRRIKYAYMDIRRIANLRGMTIRGTQKIWDSSLASIAILWAREQGKADAFLDVVYAPFWRRDLDIEDIAMINTCLTEAGVDPAGFEDWANGEGRAKHDNLRAEAEEAGMFGVPSYVWQDELFFGRDSLTLIRQRIIGEAPDWAADVGIA
ncbi:MAG: 2-hydroxychromene-2-carboxylate isomerase [Paracoccaceae bacterium]